MATRVGAPGANPPAYQTHELITLSRPSTSSSLPSYQDIQAPTSTPSGPGYSALPSYTGSAPFTPTQKLRIDARGQPALRLPCPPRPDPIPVYDVTGGDAGDGPLYVSLRARRNSGTCRLVRGSTLSTGLGEGYGEEEEGEGKGEEVLCTTKYRFGPGRPPVITLNGGGHAHEDGEERPAEEIAIESAGTFTRTQTLRTPHGTFRWRYASSKERNPPTESQTEPQPHQDSVLILEKLTAVSPSCPNSPRSPFQRQKPEQVPTEVARLVRGPGTRTPGTARSDAGNGGLLLLDLSDWIGEKRGREEEEVRALIVASCIAMLKKEVDRRRGVQAAVMVSVLSGP